MTTKYNLDISFESPKIKITYGQKFIEFKPVDYNNDFEIYNYSNIAEYRNIWDGIDLIYRKKEDSVKEIIKVHSQNAIHTFKFRLNTNLIPKKINNVFVLVDKSTNRPYFKFDDFIIFDKDSNPLNETVFVDIDKKEVTVSINPIEENLYPIQVDPSIVFIPLDSSPVKKAGRSNSVDLDIIHRSDVAGTTYHEKQHGKDYQGDPVSFSKKVDLRLNLEGPVAPRTELFANNNYNIKSIQSDVSKHKYIKLDPLNDEITESLHGEVNTRFGYLTVSNRKLESGATSNTDVMLHINSNANAQCDFESLIYDWNIFIIDRHVKKQIFNTDQIKNKKYKDKDFGSANFVDDNPMVINYEISKNIPFSYIVVFSVDVYEGEKKPQNLKGSATNFAKVFGDEFTGIPSSVYFYLDPDFIQINESNQADTFEIDTIIPKTSISFIGNNDFSWELKKFNNGTIETLISSDQYGVVTENGTIIPSEDTRTLNYTPPSDLTALKSALYIEASTTFFDPYLYEDRTIYASCILTAADFQITPNTLRPTICSQEEESFRIHNFGVRPINASADLTIPNEINNNLNWALYVDDIIDDGGANIFKTWVVKDPDAGGNEICDTATDCTSILDKWRYYGGVSSHFHINKVIENIGYTLGDRESVINYVEEGNRMPEQMFLTYSYKEGEDTITLLAIINPSSVIPEDCADETFTITLDPHCIVSVPGNKTDLDVIFSKDINDLFKTEPENFIMNWTVKRVNPDEGIEEELVLEDIIELTNNIKKIRVINPDDSVLPSTGDFLVISGFLTYTVTNQFATDYTFVFRNSDIVSMPSELEVPIKSGKRFDVEFTTNGSRVENTLTYKFNEDLVSARRKIKAEVLSPINGAVVCTVDDVINGTNQEYISQFGKLFVDYQFPIFNEATNMPANDHSYRLDDKGITYTAPLSKSNERQFVIIRLGFKNPISDYAFDYTYACVELLNPIHKNTYPDILKSRIDGVEIKDTSLSSSEFFKDLLVEPDRAYEFYISKDVNDDGNSDKYISLKNYEMKIYALPPEADAKLKMVQYHRYKTETSGDVSIDSKDGFLHVFGIPYGSIEERTYLADSIQNFNIQIPTDEDVFGNNIQFEHFYKELFDSTTGKIKEGTKIFIEIIGERTDDTLIQNSRYSINYIPTLDEEYAVYKNMKNGYVEPNPATYSTFLIDPFPTNLPDLSRYYNSGEKYYFCLVSTNKDLIEFSQNEPNNIGRYFDNTPNDSFGNSNKLSEKLNYSIELKKNTDISVQQLDGTSKTVRYANRFAFRGDDNLGGVEIVGGFGYSGTVENFFSKFQTDFASYTDSRLENRLLNTILQKIDQFTDDPEGTPTDSIDLQLLLFEWTAPTFTDDERIELEITSLSGIKPYNSGTETISNGIQDLTLNSYFESKPLIMGNPDSRPLSDDQVFEESMHYNDWNGDIYIGLEGNGMKYVVSSNLSEYEVPDVESYGVTYDASLEDNILDRFNFPEYRHKNDEIVNYDFTQLGPGGRIDPAGIDFPDTVTCFYTYFDFTNIKYMLFFGTENDGLWCFDDIDIYGPNRTLKVNGLAKKIFSPSDFINVTQEVSDTITDIKSIYPTLDLIFSTKDSVFLIPAEKIASRLLNPDTVTSLQTQTFQSSTATYVKASKFDISEENNTDFLSLGSSNFGILDIPHLRPYAIPSFVEEEKEHSGSISIVDSDIAQAIGFQMIVVTDNYVSGIDYGDVIWLISISMNIDTTRSLIDVNTSSGGSPIVNTTATSYGQRLAIDGNGDAIHIPDIQPNPPKKYSLLSGSARQEHIENYARLGANFLGEFGNNSRFTIGSMHRQQISTGWGLGLDETPTGDIVEEFGSDGLDTDGVPYSGLDRDELNEGNAYLNPIKGYYPRNTRPSATAGDTPTPGTFIYSGVGYSTHISVNDHSATLVSSSGYNTFQLHIPSDDMVSNNYDIFWRLYYNLLVKKTSTAGEVYYNSLISGQTNFSFTDDPGSEYTLIQVPRVDSIDGKSLWVYNNQENLTLKLLIQNLNTEIDNGRILYFKSDTHIMSYKLSSKTFSDGSTIKPINLVDGEFLSSLPTLLTSASSEQLAWWGGGDATTIQNYIDKTGRDFILLHHSAKRHIYNSDPAAGATNAATINRAEQRVHYNGFRANPYNFPMSDMLIYEVVPLHGNTDKDDSERNAYVPGLTYYSGEVNHNADSAGFRAYFEERNDIVSDPTSSTREKTTFIPGIAIPGESNPQGLQIDDKGTVFYAQNNKYHYLNPLGSSTPIRIFNTSFHWTHSILNFHDRGTFKGRDTTDITDFFAVNTSYNKSDKYLFPQLLDYMKVVNYFSSQKTQDTDKNFINKAAGSSWFDYKGFWSHLYKREFFLPNTSYIDFVSTGNRRRRLTYPTNPDDAYVTYHDKASTPSDTSDDTKLWVDDMAEWMFSFYPDWAYDGFYNIETGGRALNVEFSNEALPILIKQPIPSIFAEDGFIRSEAETIPWNLRYDTTDNDDKFAFDNKNWFITHFAYGTKGTEIFYTLKDKRYPSDNERDFWYNKIHVYYAGEYNIPGRELSQVGLDNSIFDFSELFEFDNDNIGEIIDVKTYGTIKSITYEQDVYEGIDPIGGETFSIDGTITLTDGSSVTSVSLIYSGGSSPPASNNPVAGSVVGNGTWSRMGFFVNGGSYTVTPVKNGYSFTPSSITFNNENYQTTDFNFIGNYTGTPPGTYALSGTAKLKDNNGFFESNHSGIAIYFENLTEGTSPQATTITDAQGNWSTTPNSGDTYRVTGKKDGYTTSSAQVLDGQPPVNLILNKKNSITLSGSVVDENGTGIPNMKITFEQRKPGSGNNAQIPELTTTTNTQGNWSTNGLINGEQIFKTLSEQSQEGDGYEGYRVRIEFYGDFPNGLYEGKMFSPKDSTGSVITFSFEDSVSSLELEDFIWPGDISTILGNGTIDSKVPSTDGSGTNVLEAPYDANIQVQLEPLTSTDISLKYNDNNPDPDSIINTFTKTNDTNQQITESIDLVVPSGESEVLVLVSDVKSLDADYTATTNISTDIISRSRPEVAFRTIRTLKPTTFKGSINASARWNNETTTNRHLLELEATITDSNGNVVYNEKVSDRTVVRITKTLDLDINQTYTVLFTSNGSVNGIDGSIASQSGTQTGFLSSNNRLVNWSARWTSSTPQDQLFSSRLQATVSSVPGYFGNPIDLTLNLKITNPDGIVVLDRTEKATREESISIDYTYKGSKANEYKIEWTPTASVTNLRGKGETIYLDIDKISGNNPFLISAKSPSPDPFSISYKIDLSYLTTGGNETPPSAINPPGQSVTPRVIAPDVNPEPITPPETTPEPTGPTFDGTVTWIVKGRQIDPGAAGGTGAPILEVIDDTTGRVVFRSVRSGRGGTVDTFLGTSRIVVRNLSTSRTYTVKPSGEDGGNFDGAVFMSDTLSTTKRNATATILVLSWIPDPSLTTDEILALTDEYGRFKGSTSSIGSGNNFLSNTAGSSSFFGTGGAFGISEIKEENDGYSSNVIVNLFSIYDDYNGDIIKEDIGKQSPIIMEIVIKNKDGEVISQFDHSLFSTVSNNIKLKRKEKYDAYLNIYYDNIDVKNNILITEPKHQIISEDNKNITFTIKIENGFFKEDKHEITIEEIGDISEDLFIEDFESAQTNRTFYKLPNYKNNDIQNVKTQEIISRDPLRTTEYPKNYYDSNPMKMMAIQQSDPMDVEGFHVSEADFTDIGLGVQNGDYIFDISYGLFTASDATNSGGSYSISGTWSGGFGEGTFVMTGFWTGTPDGPTTISIANTIESTWTTTSTTLSGTAVNLIKNGGFGQSNKNTAPATISINPSNNRWKINFSNGAWYTYDRNRPSTVYRFSNNSTAFNSNNYYAIVSSQTGTFFNASNSNYYALNIGLSGNIYGSNITVSSIGSIPLTELTGKTISTIDKAARAVVVPDVEQEEQDLPEGVEYYIPSSVHVGRNMLPCPTKAILFNSVNEIYTIQCAPPGIFNKIDYTIVPNSDSSKDWQYFYLLNAGSNSIILNDNGTTTIKNAYPEFPVNENPDNEEHWITGDTNADFELISSTDYPISNFSINFNIYQPINKNMILWSGQQHCGILIGNPNDSDLVKYMIY